MHKGPNEGNNFALSSRVLLVNQLSQFPWNQDGLAVNDCFTFCEELSKCFNDLNNQYKMDELNQLGDLLNE